MDKDWDAVAEAINTRLEVLGMTQAELATKSRVSLATVRQIQHAVPKKRSPRTLADVSEALGWPSRYLEHVSNGEASEPSGDRVAALEAAVADLAHRVDRIEGGTKRD